MKEIEIYSPARINLFLNVNGYDKNRNIYDLTTYSQTIDLYDVITIAEKKKIKNGINIITNDNIPIDTSNSAYIAAITFFEYTNIYPKSFFIKINKGIPVNSGLGGRCSDAASVLVGLNEYYNTNLSLEELLYLASLIDYDVPYFIVGDYAKSYNFGKNIISIKECYYNNFIVINTNASIDKNEIYKKIDGFNFIKRKFNNNLYNDFTKFMPYELLELKKLLNKNNMSNHLLSGYGPCYFIASSQPLLSSSIISNIKNSFPDFKVRNYKKVKGRKLITSYY